ncbi:MAG: BREX-1 system adenine-specific DNA-methyltransferase PglX [Acidimicrobiales bacterium]|nr:BREX-1 system adenine-specific DNA-methyltransferase PglX [Acidimicrobiales bacterium]
MSGLDERQRSTLERIIVTGRVAFESDLSTTLRGTYGIRPDGRRDPATELSTEPLIQSTRHMFDEILQYLEDDGTEPAQAVERLVREAAFTHLNRLVAIRVADALNVLKPSVRNGTDSTGFRQFLEVAPLLGTSALDDTGGYWTYLQRCADELAVDAPALFDPRNPLLVLRPSKAAIDKVIGLLSDSAHDDLWSADDTFGWAYQFFNTGEERKQMRDASAAPRDSRELAVRNQFFTPSYVVRFLVQNTLGRRLVDADPSTPLLDDLPLLIDPPTEQGEPINLAEVKVLDPASGSGHFLLGCYDVLEAAWRLQGVAPADAAPLIVPCLWGIDIDPRAVQVAQAAVIFRARRACGGAPLPPPNVVCATALPENSTAWATATAHLDPTLRNLIASLRDALRDAPVLGSLLKVEQRLAREIRTMVPFADDTDEGLLVTAGVARDNFGNAERLVLSALQIAADATTAQPAEQLLAAQASDAVKFVEACRHRYDAVLMNPPFGEAVPSTKEYLKAAYPWIPTKDYNLLAAFVGRGVELCKPEGYMGAITSRAGMFIKTFQDWREQVLLGSRLAVLADLGFGVMEQAMVEAAAYVLSPQRPRRDHAGVFIRLLKDPDRPTALAAAISADRRGESDQRVFRVPSEDFALIPGGPLAYWMGPSIRALFARLPRLEGAGAEARQGLASGDDFRFLRLFWEVPPARIARSRQETHQSKRWVPFAKGGEYSPYWSDIHLVLDFERDGERIRQYPGSRPQNLQHFFRPGLTWPPRTNSSFGIRVLPAGCAFGHKGPAVFLDGDASAPLAYLRSRVVQAALDAMVAAGDEVTSGGASRSYEVGLVQNLPWPFTRSDPPGELVDVGDDLIRHAAASDFADETARWFVGPDWLDEPTVRAAAQARLAAREDRWLETIDLAARADALLLDQLEIDEAGRTYLDDELGKSPAEYRDEVSDADQLADLYALPIEGLIDSVVARYGGSRVLTTLGYVADRRTEVLAHALKCHPRAVVQTRRERDLLPPEEPASTANDVVSWLVGCAFGRWDVRGVVSPEFDPFDPVPLTPPGALAGADGQPLVPADYPLVIPPDGILVDQQDSPLDLVAAVERVAAEAAEHGPQLLADAVRILGRRSLRELLAKDFFKLHVGRYSMSRRQAPVYWQLTVPAGSWSVWLYAPRFSREMLFATAAAVEQRIALGYEELRTLSNDEGRSARERAKESEAERTLIAQLEAFLVDIRRIANLGWNPDPDDGYVLNAAPFAPWFPKNAWPQTGEQLEALRGGSKKKDKKADYSWASIHKFREQL